MIQSKDDDNSLVNVFQKAGSFLLKDINDLPTGNSRIS